MRSTLPPPPPPAPPPHTQFGPYSLLERIAVGGMAEVFLAQEPRAAGEPRSVVIKRMLPHIAAEPGAKEMFGEEARLGRVVHHDNVVKLLAVGEIADMPYLSLEYVRGVDLWRMTRWLTKKGKGFGTELALFLTAELLAGLHAVHQARDEDGSPLGIIHRDVSPSNVLLSHHGDVKLGDFGIARARMRERYPQHPIGARAKGKLGYLAPEQVRGADADRRADVFAAAVICAELLMGRPLFAGGSELAVLLAIRDAKIHPFVERASQLPAGLGDVIIRALASKPIQRTGSAAALRDELMAFQTGDETALRRELAGLVSTAMVDAASVESSMPALHPAARVGLETPAQGEAREGATTGKLPALKYEVVTQDGARYGPWPYAKVVEAVATGRVGADDQVIVAGADALPVREVAELRRHLPPSSVRTITEDRDAPRPPDEEVDLADESFVTALGRLVARRDTGLLLCELGGVRKEVYVQDGAPEFVTSNLAGELLGEFLVARGVISRGELDMALAVMPRFEGRLGDTLVGLGLVEPVQLFQRIADQVREKLVDLFTWTGGTASFYRGIEPPQSGFPLGLDPWAILDEGIGRRIAEGFEDTLRAQTDRHLRRRPGPLGMRDTAWPEEAEAILRIVASPTTLGDVIRVYCSPAPPSPARALRPIVLLLRLGMIGFE